MFIAAPFHVSNFNFAESNLEKLHVPDGSKSSGFNANEYIPILSKSGILPLQKRFGNTLV